MLKELSAKEAELTKEDLKNADEILVGNSVRLNAFVQELKSSINYNPYFGGIYQK